MVDSRPDDGEFNAAMVGVQNSFSISIRVRSQLIYAINKPTVSPCGASHRRGRLGRRRFDSSSHPACRQAEQHRRRGAVNNGGFALVQRWHEELRDTRRPRRYGHRWWAMDHAHARFMRKCANHCSASVGRRTTFCNATAKVGRWRGDKRRRCRLSVIAPSIAWW